MKSLSFLSLVVALVALQGCRIEKPSTVVPPAPSIDSFTASAETVAAGGKVSLSWKASNATSIELREASTGDLPAAATQLEGSLEVTVERDSLFVLVARGAGGTDARAVSVKLEASAGELTFQALPPAIPGGASTTLVWTAPGATTVTLAAGAAMIDTRGQLTSGAVTVSPTNDTTYTLTADGRSKTVSVVVQPAVLTLQATPTAAEVGDTVTLSWTAAGAERLVITSPGRGQLAEITDATRILSGSFADVVPTLPDHAIVTYEVAAVKGTARLAKSLEVYVGSGLEIVRFDAPPVAAAGATYSVRWQTLGADQVEVKVDGVTVHRAASSSTANGQFSFTSPMQDFAVELVATNVEGGRLAQLAQVDAVGVPTAVTLTANPTAVTVGQPVTLSWSSAEARRVRITDSLGQVVFSTTGQRAEMGTATVYPTADTTWTISADNMLGNPAVTATASATVTGTGVTVTQFPPTAISGQNVLLETSAPMAVFYGFPHNRVLESAQADFVDIRSTGAKVIESGDVATVDVPFVTFLWGQRQTGSFTVSRAGWFAWGTGLSVSTSEVTLPSSSAPPGIIAAYWDDLRLTANSGVFVQVIGDAPEQQLVVQWDRMQCGTTTNTEATFQARVHQDGRVSFHYQTMNLNSNPSYVIGVQDATRTQAVRSATAAPPASNTARYIFSPVTSPVEFRVQRGTAWGGYVKVGDAKTLVSQTARAIRLPDDLSLTELMFRPAPTVPNGQYMELINRTLEPLDLTGWELRNPGNGTSFTAPIGFTLAPNVPFVLGASTDAADNDDAGVMLAWGTLSLSQDAGRITFGTADASTAFDFAGPADGGTGSSVEIDPGPIVGTSGLPGSVMCSPTTTFGSQTPLQLGSPGVERGCFSYKVISIPSRFVDVSDGGTPLINSPTSAVDGRTVGVTLATASDPAPVTFGARRETVSVSLDGWMTWETTTSTNFTNPSNPSSTSLGRIAPFWDDLQTTANASPASELYWKRVEPNEDPLTPARHWIFQWAHVRHYGTSPVDDLNFEVKLFEDGTIEYHYGEMRSGTSDAYATGNSATIWLATPAGTQALTLNIMTSTVTFPAPIRPHTAYRFIPR